MATPYGAVDFQQPGLYNVGIDNGQVLVSVLSGLAQVVGLGGSIVATSVTNTLTHTYPASMSLTTMETGATWTATDMRGRRESIPDGPVLDPLLVTPLRNAVVHSAWGRGKTDIPPGIAKKLHDTPVVTSTEPVAPRFRPDLAKSMRVNPAPARAKGQKLEVRREERPVEQQQRKQERMPQQRVEQPQAERAARPVKQQQPHGERVAAPAQKSKGGGKGKGKKP